MKLAHRHYSRAHSAVAIVLMIAFANLITSCHFYKIHSEKTPEAARAANLVQQPGKYFILHSGGEAWHLTDITVADDDLSLKGELEPLPESHELYIRGKDAKVHGLPHPGRDHFRYNPRRDTPAYEVHIYTDAAISSGSGSAAVEMSSIRRIDVYDKAVGRTTASYVFGTIGVVAGAVVVVFVIALLLKSSCPFAYTQAESGDWIFTGELYGGAIYAPLERDDYLPLPALKAAAGKASIKIANELMERQYTNLARIISVTHPAGTSVLLDKAGQPQTIVAPQEPLTAITSSGRDCKASLLTRDGQAFLFDAGSKGDEAVSSADISFRKPVGATTGKLVLKAQNSYWLDYAFGKFTESFGTYYNTFAASQKKAPAGENTAWSLAQHIPLSVEVETAQGWQLAGYFDVMGPLASRDLVMPLDLSKVKGDQVHILLRSGFMFWEVDYAAMDFTPNIPVKAEEIIATSATDETGKDVAPALASNDDQYLWQPAAGNCAVLQFRLTPAGKNETRTCFLHSRGYYEYIRNFKNVPNVPQLLSFKKSGAFTRFAKARYDAVANKKDLLSTAFKSR